MEKFFFYLLDFNGGCMRYICSMCNTMKFSGQERKYVYASYDRTVKVLVCASCHKAKIRDMEDIARANLKGGFILGVLKDKVEEPQE